MDRQPLLQQLLADVAERLERCPTRATAPVGPPPGSPPAARTRRRPPPGLDPVGHRLDQLPGQPDLQPPASRSGPASPAPARASAAGSPTRPAPSPVASPARSSVPPATSPRDRRRSAASRRRRLPGRGRSRPRSHLDSLSGNALLPAAAAGHVHCRRADRSSLRFTHRQLATSARASGQSARYRIRLNINTRCNGIRQLPVRSGPPRAIGQERASRVVAVGNVLRSSTMIVERPDDGAPDVTSMSRLPRPAGRPGADDDGRRLWSRLARNPDPAADPVRLRISCSRRRLARSQCWCPRCPPLVTTLFGPADRMAVWRRAASVPARSTTVAVRGQSRASSKSPSSRSRQRRRLSDDWAATSGPGDPS